MSKSSLYFWKVIRAISYLVVFYIANPTLDSFLEARWLRNKGGGMWGGGGGGGREMKQSSAENAQKLKSGEGCLR